MQILTSILLFIPGALELTVLVLTFFVLLAFHRVLSWKLVARAVFYSAVLLWAGIASAQSTSASVMPLQWLTYFVISLLAYVILSQKDARWHKLCFPLVVGVFALCVWQFTFVRKDVVVRATWEIAEKSTEESGYRQEYLVKFNFEGGESTTIYSDMIATHLRHKKEPTAEVTLDLLYHWGRFAGHNLKAVDGKVARWLGGGGSVGCTAVCSRYYFGLRGI